MCRRIEVNNLKQKICSFKKLQSIFDINEIDLENIREKDRPLIFLININNFNFNLELNEILIETEIERLNKFKNSGDKKRFVLNRAVTRIIIGKIFKKHPKKVDIEYNYYGKPYIDEKYKLEFSVSHSNEYIAVVFCKNKVGIDIEHIVKDIDYVGIAENYFNEIEFNQLIKLESRDKLVRFYQLWTSKESYVKAIGYGLSYSIKDIFISNVTYGGNLLFDIKSNKGVHIYIFEINKYYVGALACMN
ncbi:4'-phosphopantetheinyl transferase superfamily protein [Clostridium botulinum]|uniref:4'-phosphopantetheinyl transferase superfamily protein n=1 Tax=Clostridium botulinum TaxID=1491 RepID=A0A6M0SRC4_CLOBO|nr:4'-phosphopantetheinyl transferase superfamily protein [Clostridium botulinum]